MSSQQNYTIGNELEKGVFLATCEKDGENYIAQPVSIDAGLKDTLLLWRGQSGAMLKSLLNHENLVSMVDIIKTGSGKHASEYIVWDFCDAGNLNNLLVNPEWPVKGKNIYFYREDFVWHFLVSMLRAIAYLHEGYRDFFDVADGAKKSYKPDVDWLPVLHRDITPENIYFCHPRGKETYGLCKLGNFSRAFVSGHVSGHAAEGLPRGAGTPVAPSTKLWAGLDQMKIFTQLPGGAHFPSTKIPDRLRPYTIGSDQAAVARLALQLMRGKPTPPSGICPDCGCAHLSTFSNPRPDKYDVACVHACKYEHFDFSDAHDHSTRALEYSTSLVSLVEELIEQDGTGNLPSSHIYERAYREHKRWLATSEEGRFVNDLEYEMRRRWGETQKKFEVA